MRPWRNKKFMLVLLVLIWATIFYIIWFCMNDISDDEDEIVEAVWWAGFSAEYVKRRTCGGRFNCVFSNQRNKFKTAQAVLFYASDMRIEEEMPIPRNPEQIWALLHEESPRNVPYVPYVEFLQHFNYTSTFSRYSDLPLTTQYLPHSSDLTSQDFVESFTSKEVYRYNDRLAPVVFLQSDCDTMTGREAYVRELMRHIPIDSYGKCLHNRDLPDSLNNDYLNNLYSPELLKFLSRYYFMISIENGVCDDYITEKFWRPLMIGVIPIYFGTTTVKDWQPNNNSVIYINEFRNAKDLAAYLLKLEQDQKAYNEYLAHKHNRERPIENSKLMNELIQRTYSVSSTNLYDQFECFICKKLTERRSDAIPKMATIDHYKCPATSIYLPLESEPSNLKQWQSIMAVGHCQAMLLDEFWSLNQTYTYAKFEKALEQLVAAGLCEK